MINSKHWIVGGKGTLRKEKTKITITAKGDVTPVAFFFTTRSRVAPQRRVSANKVSFRDGEHGKDSNVKTKLLVCFKKIESEGPRNVRCALCGDWKRDASSNGTGATVEKGISRERLL